MFWDTLECMLHLKSFFQRKKFDAISTYSRKEVINKIAYNSIDYLPALKTYLNTQLEITEPEMFEHNPCALITMRSHQVCHIFKAYAHVAGFGAIYRTESNCGEVIETAFQHSCTPCLVHYMH